MRRNSVIGTDVRSIEVFDPFNEMRKWKGRCIIWVPLSFIAGLSLGLYVAHNVLR